MIFNKSKWDYALTALTFGGYAYFIVDNPVFVWGMGILAVIELLIFSWIFFLKRTFQSQWNFLICGLYLVVFSFFTNRQASSEAFITLSIGVILLGIFSFLYYKRKRLSAEH